MTLVQLANFIRIAELRSVSKAAANVGIAQPALSRQVRQLEEELGARLLVRQGWGVTPTPAGEALLEHARRLLAAAQAARDAVHSTAVEPAGRVTLGAPGSVAVALLPALGACLQERYPLIRPHFIDGASESLQARVLSGELDLAILYKDRVREPIVASPLLQERLALVGPPGAAIDPALKANELLRTTPMILPSRTNRHRLLVEQMAGEHPLRVVMEVDSLAVILGLVEAGQGFTVASYSSVAGPVASRKLSIFPLNPPTVRTLMLARLDVRSPSAAVAAVAREICQIVVALEPVMGWTPLFGSGEPVGPDPADPYLFGMAPSPH